jgi:hypothetical protein
MEPTRGYCCHATSKARKNGWENAHAKLGQRLTSDRGRLLNEEEQEREQCAEVHSRRCWNSGMGL